MAKKTNKITKPKPLFSSLFSSQTQPQSFTSDSSTSSSPMNTTGGWRMETVTLTLLPCVIADPQQAPAPARSLHNNETNCTKCQQDCR